MMTLEEATNHLRATPSGAIEYAHRDATGAHWIEVRCYLDSHGDLVQPHPTDGERGPIGAPKDVAYFAVSVERLRKEREWGDYLARLDVEEGRECDLVSEVHP